jgi:hypothetical protein
MLVALGAACMLLWRVWVPGEGASPSALAAGAAMVVLVVARLIRRSPLPPACVPPLVAAPLATLVATAALSGRALAEPAVAAAGEDLARLACMGLVLAAEGISTPVARPSKRRRGPASLALALALVLACAVGELVLHHARVREGGLALASAAYTGLAAVVVVIALVRAARDDRCAATEPLLALVSVGLLLWLSVDLLEATRVASESILTPELVRAAAAPMLSALGAIGGVLAIAVAAVLSAETFAWRIARALLAAPLAILPMFLRAPEGPRDPMRSARELGVDPPVVWRTMRSWVGVDGTWDARDLVLDLRGRRGADGASTDAPASGAPTFLRRSGIDRPLVELPVPVSPRARSQHDFDTPIVVLASRSSTFAELVAGLRVLGARRHGVWLAAAPGGWRWLGGWRGLLARSAPAFALGLEPTLAGDRGPDDYVTQMGVDGPALGLAIEGAVARCARVDAKVVDDRVRWTVQASCGLVPLDEASAERRRALIRETGARHVLLAPEPLAPLQSVVDVLARLSEEIAEVMMEDWTRSCPPPAICEPHVSWETGSPRVWLTADRTALQARSP